MRQTHYLIRDLGTGEIRHVPFVARDFVLARVQYAPLGGLPILEAHQLVNQWNIDQDSQRYVYALPAQA